MKRPLIQTNGARAYDYTKGNLKQDKLLEYFPVRRSSRKTKQQLEYAEKLSLYRKIITGENEIDLKIDDFDEKGRGIRANRNFEKGEFVIEYKGEIITAGKAKHREVAYAKDPDVGSYMYYFVHKGTKWCVDATKETKYKGRLINHSFFTPNLKTKVVDFEEKGFFLCLFAVCNIKKGDELLYDYGDRSAKSINENPWLLTT